MLPNKIEGAGIEIFLLDSAAPLSDQTTRLNLHTLIVVLDGSITAASNASREIVAKDEAIMMKKDASVRLTVPSAHSNPFRCLVIFFDEPSLRYALLPFELVPNSSQTNLLKVPLNEKLNVFTESILLYYKNTKEEKNWTALLQNKLRELVWIFFHTEVREQAREFFSSPK